MAHTRPTLAASTANDAAASARRLHASVHGHADQQPLSAEDVTGYFPEAQTLLGINTPEGAAAVVDLHREALMDMAVRMETLQALSDVRAHAEAKGLRRILPSVEIIHPYDAAILVGGFGLAVERNPAQFKDVRAVAHQLLLHMEALADASGLPPIKRDRAPGVTAAAAGLLVLSFGPVLRRIEAALRGSAAR